MDTPQPRTLPSAPVGKPATPGDPVDRADPADPYDQAGPAPGAERGAVPDDPSDGPSASDALFAHYARPGEPGGSGPRPERRSAVPAALHAPLSGRTWRAYAHVLTGLPLSIALFAWTAVLAPLGAGLLVTFLGVPVLAALFASARGTAALERTRAAALLGVRVEAPRPRRPKRPGMWAWMTSALADGANWRALLYNVVLLPWTVFTFTVSTVWLCTGWAMLLYPAWRWVYPAYLGQPGIQVYGNASGTAWYLSSGVEIWAACLAGLLLVLASPWVVRGLTAVHAALVRGLLGRGAAGRR